jgi:hypothetical protein
MTPCGSSKKSRSLKGIYLLHNQGNETLNQSLVTLKMEAIFSFETSVLLTRPTRCYIIEDNFPHYYRIEKYPTRQRSSVLHRKSSVRIHSGICENGHIVPCVASKSYSIYLILLDSAQKDTNASLCHSFCCLEGVGGTTAVPLTSASCIVIVTTRLPCTNSAVIEVLTTVWYIT